MIVAHPDDEVIFGGATLLSSRGWKVLCVTCGRNDKRRREFETVMVKLGCAFDIWSYPDNPYDPLASEVATRIESVVKKPWETIVSHGEYGEYGHRHHIQLHQAINDAIGSNFYTFCQGPKLEKTIWWKKLRLLAIYKTQSDMCHKLLDRAKRESITKMI